MNLIPALIFGVFMNCLVALEGVFAYRDSRFNPQQFRTLRYGMPFIGHGGMWSDLFLLNMVLVLIVAQFSGQWRLLDHWILIGIAQVINVAFHVFWMHTNTEPDCLATQGKLERAGWFHVIYQGLASVVVGLFYFATVNIPPAFLITVSVLLAVHLMIGTHMVLSFVKPKWWQHDTLRDPKNWFVVGILWIALAWRTYLIYQAQ